MNMEIEKFQMSRAIVHLYQKLANLEKQYKKNTNEYNGLLNLLPTGIEQEKQELKSLTLSNEEVQKVQIYLNAQMYTDNCFQIPLDHMITVFRAFKHMPHEYVRISKNAESNLNRMLINNLMIQIENYLKQVKVMNDQCEHLIDYKYLLLSSTISLELEDKLLSHEALIPYQSINITLTDLNNILLIFENICEYVFSLTDKSLKNDIIVYILYIKTLLEILPQEIYEAKLAEISKMISMISDVNKDHLYKMLINILQINSPTKVLR